MSFRANIALVALAVCSFTASAWSAPKSAGFVELQVGDTKHQGRIAAKTNRHCWLMDRAGRITPLQLSKVTAFRKVSSRFSAHSSTTLNSSLARELGQGFEIRTTRHYVVAAPQGRARQYADLFESIYRTFYMHFAVRGFRIAEPEFPMVAIIFPSQRNFARYASSEGVKAQSGLLGYYMPYSNRVALFEGRSRQTSQLLSPALRSDASGLFENGQQALEVPQPFATIQAGLRDTMIHEATHQVAFNVGLHARIGENPKWVVEGLATVFEPDGIRDSSKGRSIRNRINRERYVWFQNFVKKRRKPDSLAAFVQGDDLFRTNALDAYAQAWALSFFLIETRARDYAGFLKKTANRDHMTQLTRQERLRVFSSSFRGNTKLLEAEFLRFFKRLE